MIRKTVKAVSFFLFLLACSAGCTIETLYVRCNISKITSGQATKVFTYAGNRVNTITTTSVDDATTTITTSTYSYDGSGNVSKVTDDKGTYKTYVYNNNNQLVREEGFSGTPVVMNYKADYEYNIYGQLTKIQAYTVDKGVSTKSDYYTFTYASVTSVNVTARNRYQANGSSLGSNTYDYDDRRNVLSGLGLNIAITGIPVENNVIKNTQKDGQGNTSSTTTFTYTYNSNNLPTATSYSVVLANGSTQVSLESYSYECFK